MFRVLPGVQGVRQKPKVVQWGDCYVLRGNVLFVDQALMPESTRIVGAEMAESASGSLSDINWGHSCSTPRSSNPCLLPVGDTTPNKSL